MLDSGAGVKLLLFAFGAAGAGLYYFVRSIKEIRHIQETPRSLIRSAAQGYVEISGRADFIAGGEIVGMLSALPCVWFRYRVEKRYDGNKWRKIEDGESEECFQVSDSTGTCIVSPAGATVIPCSKSVWHGDSERPTKGPNEKRTLWESLARSNYRYTEERIPPGKEVYVLGDLKTQGDRVPLSDAVRDRVRTMKLDQVGLLRDFDTDRDGKIDLTEWTAVQKAAEKSVQEARLSQAENFVNIISKPAISKHTFMISTVPEDGLIKRQRRALWGGALSFIIGVGVSIWIILAMRTP